MDIEVVTPPSATAHLDIVPVARLKAHLRISHSAEDDLLDHYIASAVDWMHGREGYLQRTVLPMTWRAHLSGFGRSRVYLPLPPVLAITGIAYRDEFGIDRTLAPSGYVALTGEMKASIDLADGQSWPVTQIHGRAVSITYTAGYAAAPVKIEQAALLLAAHWYRSREAAVDDSRITKVSKAIEFGVANLLSGLVVPPSSDL